MSRPDPIIASMLDNARQSGIEHIDVHITTEAEGTVRISLHGSGPEATQSPIGTTTVRHRRPTLVEADVATAARFHPGKVRLRTNDDPWRTVTQQRFLAGTCRTESFGRYTLGVAKGTWDHPFSRLDGDPDTCESGTLRTHALARTTDAYRTVHWSVRADTNEPAPVLEPDRTAERSALRNRSWQALYRAMNEDPDTAASWLDWRRATKMGIALAPPPRALLPWRAPTAQDLATDRQPVRRADERRPLRPDTLLVDEGLNAIEARILIRAAAVEPQAFAERLMTPADALEGFGWYDRLPRIVQVRTRTGTRDEWEAVVDPRDPMDPTSARALATHAKRIQAVLTIHTRGKVEREETVETDLTFAAEPVARFPDETYPIVRNKTDLTARHLADLIEDTFFEPCENVEAGSTYAQRTRFADEALATAAKILCDEKEELRLRLAWRTEQNLRGLVVESARPATIRIEADGTVDVTVAERQHDADR